MVRIVTAILATLMATQAICAQPIVVGAAISLREALTEIAAHYKTDTGNEVDLTFGSSGQILAKIRAGAPIDLFISAANIQVDDAIRENLADQTSRRVVAGNSLVLIVPPDARNVPVAFKDLASAKRLAIGEPKTVPAGLYAAEVLKAQGLWDSLADRLIYGANVRQVLDYVIRGEVNAGIVFSTDAAEAGDKVKIVATADPTDHQKIQYPAVVVRATGQRAAADRFLDHLATDAAQHILRKHGFSIPTPQPTTATTTPTTPTIPAQ